MNDGWMNVRVDEWMGEWVGGGWIGGYISTDLVQVKVGCGTYARDMARVALSFSPRRVAQWRTWHVAQLLPVPLEPRPCPRKRGVRPPCRPLSEGGGYRNNA